MMKLKPVFNNAKPCLGFKSHKLYDVKIYDGQKLIPAKFTELDVNSQEDGEAITEIQKNWKKATYKDEIATPFLKCANAASSRYVDSFPYSYYAVELADENLPLSQKIKGVAQCNDLRKEKKIEYLQVSSDSNNETENRRYKHIGKMLTYGVVKKANDENNNCVKLDAIKDDTQVKKFYSAIGFEETLDVPAHIKMILKNDKFIDCLNSIEKEHELELTV